MFKIGDTVGVGSNTGRYSGAVDGMSGKVTRTLDQKNGIIYGIKIAYAYNENARHGLFWFPPELLTLLSEKAVRKAPEPPYIVCAQYDDSPNTLRWFSSYENYLYNGPGEPPRLVVSHGGQIRIATLSSPQSVFPYGQDDVVQGEVIGRIDDAAYRAAYDKLNTELERERKIAEAAERARKKMELAMLSEYDEELKALLAEEDEED